ncbi:TPA: hypothetical protein ACY3HR_004820 [Citrobacter freundii]
MKPTYEELEIQLANAESKCRELAAESDKTSERMQQLIQIINNADNDYCMCGDAMKNHTHGGCGHPTGMFDYHYNQWLQAENKTPATDAFLAEVRAQGVEMLVKHCEQKALEKSYDFFMDAGAVAAHPIATGLMIGSSANSIQIRQAHISKISCSLPYWLQEHRCWMSWKPQRSGLLSWRR